MKEKINSNKKILVLILLIVLLLASTYAWFINNASVSVTGITASVEKGTNIQIAATNTTTTIWKNRFKQN